MDFYRILRKVEKDGTVVVYPDWQVEKCTDLMVHGHAFYAFWDEEEGLWSRDEFRLRHIIDADLWVHAKQNVPDDAPMTVLTTQSFSTHMWETFQKYLRNFPDNYVPLDADLTFADSPIRKDDYASKRLPYSLQEEKPKAWIELLRTLYSPEERKKLEWAIGAVVAGEAKHIQKFLVLYGPPASGKSTVLNIIQKLFDGYTTTFDAAALGRSGATFATDVFKSNPLVGIQHDGDLSRIEDNTRLNSITSHEDMPMNEKYKASYTARVNAFLFMGTNKPVKITDSKAGTIRRLIDVHPTGNRLDPSRYHMLMRQVGFELGAIAWHCLQKYREMGMYYYNNYKPIQMMYQTDDFYNFVISHFDIFKAEDGTTLKRAWTLYKEWCDEVNIARKMPYSTFREELLSYFETFHDRLKDGDEWLRSYYQGFKGVPESEPFKPDTTHVLELIPVEELSQNGNSVFDRTYFDMPAQASGPEGHPPLKWANSHTLLQDIDPVVEHFVKVPADHIVIDFDLVDEDGNKDLARNLEAASAWPPTYAEVSKSGHGVHLHYIYAGDTSKLANVFDVGIEVKTLLGDSSLRRKLTLCNDLEIARISEGLPFKEVKPVIDKQQVESERGLRKLIERNLQKEIHPSTKSSIDFIKTILDEAYDSGLSYDVSDLKPVIFTFAARSTNRGQYCMQEVAKMKFQGQEAAAAPEPEDDAPVVFYDVEVYPNLFLICWKYRGADNVVRMINPTAKEVEALLQLKLIGFNNRRYDNHMIYARMLGYTNEQIFRLSQRIIADKDRGAMFGEAYELSYADIYDFSSLKQGLKKFMIELGITHMELDIPWDKPVPQELWPQVEEYCVNDVLGTEATFESRYQDFVARQILAELSGLSVNHTTQNHTAKIIFGNDKKPQSKFVYTDLSETFEGYAFNGSESHYRGEVTGEGGYVYAEPGIYEQVALLDVASMHPTSIVELNLFGDYTPNFQALMDARLAIKHGDFDRARSDAVLDGKLAQFLKDAESDDEGVEALSYALKIVINTVYGLTSAHFENAFRDWRNKDNIVAKRGALFMVDLKYAVQEKGYTVVHIKTDSIKIANPDDFIIDFVYEFGKKYGYEFEHEATYEKFCLVNDAVYIARSGEKWTAVGKQFQHPYVYKELFTKEPHDFDDFCEVRNVTKGTMYLDFDGSELSKDMVHVGRTGSFVPVLEKGGSLWRIVVDDEGNEKKYAVAGTKDYRWMVRDVAMNEEFNVPDDLFIDMTYFDRLANEARDAIEQFGSYEQFVS